MPGRVLLVDDDANILRAYVRVLDDPRLEIHTAQSVAQALALLSVSKIHVIVADQFMEELTGIDLFSRTRLLYPDAVRILLTGQPKLDVALDAVNNGEIFRFLLKPCSTQTLRAMIHQGLQHHRKMAQGLRLLQLLDASVDAMDPSIA